MVRPAASPDSTLQTSFIDISASVRASDTLVSRKDDTWVGLRHNLKRMHAYLSHSRYAHFRHI